MPAASLIETAFEALLERTRGDPVLILVDDRLRILRAAPQATALADRADADLAGMSLIAALGSAPLDAVARAALAAGEPVVGEAQLGPLGRHTFQIDAVPLGGGGAVLALHDITALRRIERVRRDFVANISHELRTPLTSIKLLAETLASGVDDAATAHDFATQIEREVDHLAQLVDELLDLTVIESGEVRLAIESLDPNLVVASVVERIGPVADRRGIAIRALPAPDTAGARRGRSGTLATGAHQPRPQRGQVQPPRRRGPTWLGGARRPDPLRGGR